MCNGVSSRRYSGLVKLLFSFPYIKSFPFKRARVAHANKGCGSKGRLWCLEVCDSKERSLLLCGPQSKVGLK